MEILIGILGLLVSMYSLSSRTDLLLTEIRDLLREIRDHQR
jgi:hypothetical protein